MGRIRMLVVALITGIVAFGVPIFISDRPHVPDVVTRDVSLAQGTTLEPTATRAASIQKRASKLGMQGNLVAVSFDAKADHEALERDLTVETRFRTSKGWGSWEKLTIEGDEGPDLNSPEAAKASKRIFAGPIWVGTADQVDVRMRSEAGGPSARDIKVHVINSKGDSQKPTYFHRAVGAISRLLRGGNTPAYAMTVRPRMFMRNQWGANESWRDHSGFPKYASTVHMAFIHHTAGSNRYSRSESAAIVRSIYRYHTSNRGWSDIGYNFLIDRYGQVFEGRYGGIYEAVRGAHAGGFNWGSTGVSLMGTFTSAVPTSAMLSALRRLLAWKLDVHHAPPTGTVRMTSSGSDRFPVGTRRTFNRISGHADAQWTACPGREVYRRIPSIRDAVRAIGDPKIYLPTVLPTPAVSPNGDGIGDSVTIGATLNRPLYWLLTIRTSTGVMLRSFNGKGSTISVVWNGKTADAEVPAHGYVTYTIEARSWDWLRARPATGTIFVSNPPPPTPTPTPTDTGTSEPDVGTTGSTESSPTETPEAGPTGTPSSGPTGSPSPSSTP